LRGVRVWKEEAPKPAREEKQEQAKVEDGKPVALGDALFGASSFGRGGSANPFRGGGGGSSSTNPFAKTSDPEMKGEDKLKPEEVSTAGLAKSFAETLALNVPPAQPAPPPEPWPAEDKMPPPYPTLFLADADYETLDPTPTNVPANARVEAADAEEPSAIDREAFESSMDAAFQKFADRLAQNPEQVIRYEHGGTPLLYSKTDSIGKKLASGGGIPGCANCGARRTFEVQLTPQAIVELEGDDMSLDGMEWGTIIIGVCERDCRPRATELGQSGYLEEWAGVQWEELAK
jgi:pre-rRNA-processing protein TSR4